MKPSAHSISAAVMTVICAICSCTQQISVTDYSFEFSAQVSYNDQLDSHQLTLTRVSGLEENRYNIAFTLDGENTLTLQEPDDRLTTFSLLPRCGG